MINFENVGLRYDASCEILSDINLHIPAHSFHFLCGPSGSGKTSLLNLISLMIRPSRGIINILGQDSSKLERQQKHLIRRQISVVYQDFRLLEHLNIYQNVSLALRVRGYSEANYHSQVCDLLNWVGLGHRITAFPAALSGGEKQRVAIARAVITKPQILLADEPTGNVDFEMARRLLQLFAALNKFGTAVILATHDFTLIEQIKARTIIIENKRLNIYE